MKYCLFRFVFKYWFLCLIAIGLASSASGQIGYMGEESSGESGTGTGVGANSEAGSDEKPKTKSKKGSTSKNPKKKKAKKKKKKSSSSESSGTSSESSSPSSSSSSSGPHLGVAFNIGYEASFGHSVTFHYWPLGYPDYLEFLGGIGYNSTGMKAGGGGALVLPMSDSYALRFGGAFVYSMGVTNQKVQVESKFTPEGGGNDETVIAERQYDLGAATLASFFVGLSIKLWDNLNLVGQGNYNVVLSGNEVTFKSGTKYNKNIEVTNDDEFNKEFEDEAAKKVVAGGLGGSGGLQILF